MAFDLKGEVEKYRQQQMMMGRAPIEEFGGGDPTEFLTNLYFNDAKLADQWAQQSGLNRDAFLANVSRVNQSAQDRRGSNVFSTIGNLTRIGRGEATGFDDFFRDAAALAAVGYGTSFLPGGGAGGGAAGSAGTAEGLAPITLSPSVAPISSPVGAAWAAPNATAASSPAASAFGPASSGSGGFFSRLGDMLRGNSYRAPNLGSGSNYQPQPVVPMRTQMARGLLSTGNPSPSPARSLMAQQLLAQALRGPNQSGSLVESAAIAAPHILSALLMKQEQKAQAQAQQQRATQQQALAGALSRSTQSDPYKSEAARRAAMIISGGLPDDPLAQSFMESQIKTMTTGDKDLFGVVNPSDFTPESLARFEQSRNYGDLERISNTFGRYTPSNYTPESWAQFMQSGDPASLKLRPDYRFNQTPSGALVAGNTITGEVSPTSVTPERAIDEASQRKRAETEAVAQGEATGKILARAMNAEGIEDILDIAEPLIDEATGSGSGAARDKLAAFFGVSTTGAQATAQLLPLQAAIMLRQPRMEGPQSDRDVQLYREAAGQLGDPSVPRETKKAAIQTIRRLQQIYKDDPTGSAAAPTTAPKRVRVDAQGNVIGN